MPTLARALLSALVVLTIATAADARGPKGGVTYYTVERPIEDVGPGTLTSISVGCESGDQVVAGGYRHTTDQPDLQVSASHPSGEAGWIVQIQNFSETLAYQVVLFARCARLTP